MNDGDWCLAPLTNDKASEVLDLVCREFFPNSTLHQAVGMQQSEFDDYMKNAWEDYLNQRPISGLVAMDKVNKRLLGCLIPAPFPSIFGNLDQLRPGRRSISLLLQRLENSYLKREPDFGHALMVDIAVVSASARGQGIYQTLRQEFESLSAEQGYDTVLGALSSAATQRVCVEKLHHEVVAEIRFADYREQAKSPFSTIRNPESIQLVVARLK